MRARRPHRRDWVWQRRLDKDSGHGRLLRARSRCLARHDPPGTAAGADGEMQHGRALAAFIRRAGAALRPGGILLFDFLEPCPGRPRQRTHHTCGADWAVLVKVSEERQVITRQITTIRFAAGRCRCSQETHRQCRLSRRQVGQALRAAGFIVTLHDGYGGMHLPPGHIVAEALKTFH